MVKTKQSTLVTGKLVAAGFKVSKRTLWRWRNQRKLPCVQVGKHWLFELEAVEAWAREQGLEFSLPDRVLTQSVLSVLD